MRAPRLAIGAAGSLLAVVLLRYCGWFAVGMLIRALRWEKANGRRIVVPAFAEIKNSLSSREV